VWQQISAPISPSSSGSPVFDKQGKVIGIVTSSLKGEGNQNLNFSTPSNYLLDLIKQHNIPFRNFPKVEEKETSFTSKVCAYLKRSCNIVKKGFNAIFN
jgi:hypothetical protein